MKKIILFLLMIVSVSSYAEELPLDVYGVDGITKTKILHTLGDEIRRYAEEMKKINMSNAEPTQSKKQTLKMQKKQLLKKVHSFGNFAFVKFSPVFYPGVRKVYLTIDIVTKHDRNRIPKSKKRLIKHLKNNDSELKLLYKLWSDYVTHNNNLMYQEGYVNKMKSCPFVHCIWGFDKSEEKKYVKKFREIANHKASVLMEQIRFSPNQQQRADAIFLLAHADDYNKTASFLAHFIDDNDSVVRNNVMRVLGGIVFKHNVKNIPLAKIIKALDYPYVTDRNKAASILFGLVNNDKMYHKEILTKAGPTLIKLLALKQPNNHDFAYLILKKISHKDYSELDMESWKKWMKNNS